MCEGSKSLPNACYSQPKRPSLKSFRVDKYSTARFKKRRCGADGFSQAFHAAWRGGALLNLRKSGMPTDLEHFVDDFVTHRYAAVRIGSCNSCWAVSFVERFPLHLLSNDLAAAITRVCPGVACGLGCHALRAQILLRADEVVILTESAADLQRAVVAARAWASAPQTRRTPECT